MQTVRVNGLNFSCSVEGDAERGTPVLLLHGFPETSHIWIPLMRALADRGYYCVAPDMRGYSEGARPDKTKAYQMQSLCEDAVGIAQALGFERFHLIGHDWGAIVGWAMLSRFPKEVQSFVSLSIPHMRGIVDALKHADQRKKSSYVALFQIPLLSEWLLTRNGSKRLRALWRDSSPEQVADFLKVFGNREGTRAALKYYRANKRELLSKSPVDYFAEAHHPVLLIWGKSDLAIGRDWVEAARNYMQGPYKFVELEVGHWLPTEAEDEVLAHVVEHLESMSAERAG